MRRLVLGLLLLAVGGCAGGTLSNPMGPPVPIYSDNPLLIPLADPYYVWEGVVGVVSDYFKVEREEPVKVVGDVLTEGRLDTYPEVGSTLLEPWRHDSADSYERVESTLQSIRRTARVRVIPSQSGFLVEVAVFKYLEDVKHPAHASAGAATFQPESSLTRVVSPVGEQEVNKGWIPLGRDQALEQRILSHLQERLKVVGRPPAPAAIPVPQPVAPRNPPVSPSVGPAAPSSPAGCRLGAWSPLDGPRERTIFRAQSPDDVLGPSQAQVEFADGTLEAGPGAPRTEPFCPVGSEPEGLGLEGPSGCGFEPGSVAGAPEEYPDSGELAPAAGKWPGAWRAEARQFVSEIRQDYSVFYSVRGLMLMGIGIGTAAVFANTSLDEHFRQWHDEHVFTHDTSRFAYVMREFGNGKYMVPLFAFCALTRPAYEPGSVNWLTAEWGNRSLRSFLVGAPALLAVQYGLGGARPENDSPHSSHWTPFRGYYAASGHAFIGAVVFLNAATLTDNLPLQASLVAASILPGWSRIIQDKHYLSQVMLGWWLGYLSTSAVDWSDRSNTSWIVSPVAMADGLGVGVLHAW
jgi:membrane-associated phospholipid phosphatase